MGINKVILVGNVGRDPEMKALPSGTNMAKFSLATSEPRFKDQDREAPHRVAQHRRLGQDRRALRAVGPQGPSALRRGSHPHPQLREERPEGLLHRGPRRPHRVPGASPGRERTRRRQLRRRHARRRFGLELPERRRRAVLSYERNEPSLRPPPPRRGPFSARGSWRPAPAWVRIRTARRNRGNEDHWNSPL